MAKRKPIKTIYAEINSKKSNLFSKFFNSNKENDFSDLDLLRKLLSKQKARIILTLKNENPKSIYELAKILNRDLKSVNKDIKFLKRFGIIEFHSNKIGKRESLAPVLLLDGLNISIAI